MPSEWAPTTLGQWEVAFAVAYPLKRGIESRARKNRTTLNNADYTSTKTGTAVFGGRFVCFCSPLKHLRHLIHASGAHLALKTDAASHNPVIILALGFSSRQNAATSVFPALSGSRV